MNKKQNIPAQADLFDGPRYASGEPVYKISDMCQRIFKHKHVWQDRPLVDVRALEVQDDDPQLHEFNFLGFRVDQPEGPCFFHIMMLADHRTALLDGIEQEMQYLRMRHPELPSDAVKLVFYRNLGLQHPDLFPSRYRGHLGYFVDDFMEFQSESRFAMVVMNERNKLVVEEEYVQLKDGLPLLSQTMHNPEFVAVFDLQQAHEANYEFNALYYRAVRLLANIMAGKVNLDALGIPNIGKVI